MTPDIPDHLFTCIDHVGIAVPDLDEAITFYRDAFGMEVQHQETNEEQGVREAMVAVGSSGSCIQLLAPIDESSTIAKFLERSGPGIQQLAYRVTDVEQVSAVLRERGLRLLYDAPKRGTSDSKVNFIHPKDAGGVLVELVEPADHRRRSRCRRRPHLTVRAREGRSGPAGRRTALTSHGRPHERGSGPAPRSRTSCRLRWCWSARGDHRAPR